MNLVSVMVIGSVALGLNASASSPGSPTQWTPVFLEGAECTLETYGEDLPVLTGLEESLGGWYQSFLDDAAYFNVDAESSAVALTMQGGGGPCPIEFPCTGPCTAPCTYLCTFECSWLCTIPCTLPCSIPCTFLCTGVCTKICTYGCTFSCTEPCTFSCTYQCTQACTVASTSP